MQNRRTVFGVSSLGLRVLEISRTSGLGFGFRNLVSGVGFRMCGLGLIAFRRAEGNYGCLPEQTGEAGCADPGTSHHCVNLLTRNNQPSQAPPTNTHSQYNTRMRKFNPPTGSITKHRHDLVVTLFRPCISSHGCAASGLCPTALEAYATRAPVQLVNTDPTGLVFEVKGKDLRGFGLAFQGLRLGV